MSRIPTPDRGQPIDVSYIYQIVDAVNDIAKQAASPTKKYTSVDTSVGPQSFLTSESKIVGGEIPVYSSLTAVTAGATFPFSYSFNGEYKYPPIVTATPILIDGATSGQDVSIIINSITTSRIDGVVKFNTSGSLAVKIHVIAVGVPN